MNATLNNREVPFSSYQRMLPILALIALAVSLFVVQIAAEEVYTGEAINLESADGDLEIVLGHFSEISGFAFAIDPQTVAQDGLNRKVDVLYEDTPWDRVFDEVLSDAGLEWTLEGKVMWIHLPGFAPSGDRNFTGEPIKLRLDGADIRDVMGSLSKITGYTIELDPQIQGKVSVRLDGIPWDQVLDLILTIEGLGYEVEGETLHVFRKTDARGKQIL